MICRLYIKQLQTKILECFSVFSLTLCLHKHKQILNLTAGKYISTVEEENNSLGDPRGCSSHPPTVRLDPAMQMISSQCGDDTPAVC